MKQIVSDHKIISHSLRSGLDDDYIAYYTHEWNFKNVHSIAHECKVWISEQYPSFSVKWANHKAVGTEEFQVRIWLNNECIGKAKTETEAIFKACEYILKEYK